MIFYEKVSYLCCKNSFFVASDIDGFCPFIGGGKLCKTDLSPYDGIFYSGPLFWERVTWEQKNVSMMKKMKAGLSFLSQFFYILTFFYKYVFFPLLNKIHYV